MNKEKGLDPDCRRDPVGKFGQPRADILAGSANYVCIGTSYKGLHLACVRPKGGKKMQRPPWNSKLNIEKLARRRNFGRTCLQGR